MGSRYHRSSQAARRVGACFPPSRPLIAIKALSRYRARSESGASAYSAKTQPVPARSNPPSYTFACAPITVVRVLTRVALGVLCVPLMSAGQQPPPAAPAGVVPPDQNLPPHIRKLTGFGERAEFSLDSKRVLFLSKTFGDAMEIDLATGVIRNLTAHFPHFGFTRALYLSNGHILLSGPTEFNPADVGAARTNCWLFVLDPAGNARPQPLGVKAAEGPVPSRKRMHIAWSYRAAQFPGWRHAGILPDPRSRHRLRAEGPKLANQRKILDSRDLPFRATWSRRTTVHRWSASSSSAPTTTSRAKCSVWT